MNGIHWISFHHKVYTLSQDVWCYGGQCMMIANLWLHCVLIHLVFQRSIFPPEEYVRINPVWPQQKRFSLVGCHGESEPNTYLLPFKTGTRVPPNWTNGPVLYEKRTKAFSLSMPASLQPQPRSLDKDQWNCSNVSSTPESGLVPLNLALVETSRVCHLSCHARLPAAHWPAADLFLPVRTNSVAMWLSPLFSYSDKHAD